MKISRQQIVSTFAAGALAALPLVATVLIVVWTVRFIYAYVGPGSWFGDFMQLFGFGMVGSELLAYLIGIAAVVVFIFALGLLVKFGLATVAANVVSTVVQRIPVVRNIYDVVKSLVDLFGKRDKEKLQSMSPVWLHFGGSGSKGAAVLGLLSTSEPVMVGGEPYVAVLVPTAPVPVGGGLLFVPQGWITPADVGVDGLTSIYVSMGVTSHQYIGVKSVTPITPTTLTRPTAPITPTPQITTKADSP